VAEWLCHAGASRGLTDSAEPGSGAEKAAALVRDNVAAQLSNFTTIRPWPKHSHRTR
jgi:hypothetical protein